MVEMSIWGLFSNASGLVQGIMVALVAISLISWTFIFQRARFFRQANQSLDQFEEQFWSGTDLNRLYDTMTSREDHCSGLSKIFLTGFKEFARFKQNQLAPEVVMQGVERSMQIAVQKESEQLESKLSFLATVGSVSPYVGLFGTVWGIMHSFMALGSVQQATLSMVAPGIAEALVATAMGLFAAIPAVIAYNRFNHYTEALLAKYDTFREEFINILLRSAYSKSGN